MTPISVLTLRLAVLQAVDDRLKKVNADTRDELRKTLAELGAEKAGATLPDGTRVASVTVAGADRRASAKVTDQHAFLAWVKEHHPEEIEERVRETYKKRVIAEAEKQGVEVPGVTLGDPAPYLICKSAKGGKDAIAAAWQSGALSLPEVLELPAGGDEQ